MVAAPVDTDRVPLAVVVICGDSTARSLFRRVVLRSIHFDPPRRLLHHLCGLALVKVQPNASFGGIVGVGESSERSLFHSFDSSLIEGFIADLFAESQELLLVSISMSRPSIVHRTAGLFSYLRWNSVTVPVYQSYCCTGVYRSVKPIGFICC
jgi:hypothetical protein